MCAYFPRFLVDASEYTRGQSSFAYPFDAVNVQCGAVANAIESLYMNCTDDATITPPIAGGTATVRQSGLGNGTENFYTIWPGFKVDPTSEGSVAVWVAVELYQPS